MPALIAKHQKKVVVTRLEKFYSTMNQAVKLSLVENDSSQFTDEGAVLNGNADETYEWYNKYLNKYVKTVSVNKTRDGIFAGMPDGSGFGIYSLHIFFCPNYKKCEQVLNENSNED